MIAVHSKKVRLLNMEHNLNKANIDETPHICMSPSAELKGMLLSKALTCMKFFLYKQKWLFYHGDGYLWLYWLYEQFIHLKQITLRPNK